MLRYFFLYHRLRKRETFSQCCFLVSKRTFQLPVVVFVITKWQMRSGLVIFKLLQHVFWPSNTVSGVNLISNKANISENEIFVWNFKNVNIFLKVRWFRWLLHRGCSFDTWKILSFYFSAFPVFLPFWLLLRQHFFSHRLYGSKCALCPFVRVLWLFLPLEGFTAAALFLRHQ